MRAGALLTTQGAAGSALSLGLDLVAGFGGHQPRLAGPRLLQRSGPRCRKYRNAAGVTFNPVSLQGRCSSTEEAEGRAGGTGEHTRVTFQAHHHPRDALPFLSPPSHKEGPHCTPTS